MTNIDDPRMVQRDGFTVVGLSTRATGETDLGAHWSDFENRHRSYTDRIGSDEAYGVLFDFDSGTGSFTYLVGVEPSNETDVPSTLDRVEVPGGTYAVFTVPLDEVGTLMDYVYDEWFPSVTFERTDDPEFEYYGPDFDPRDAEATLDVYVPVDD
ncbi:GyrI-like domain-containing protein [Haloarchaeobius litoreus]|uniref:GyrI-like domain-containing protein n=1 Tax=Haloarchaeobius litoreus TaxID=755306 RepID=A0ABD6DKL8_9EURY|nr:GyrI-like domain-containing protein [Haloarchaeobius litoreus]